jgi:uncharacterized repeat protein (TIGR03803 family)
MNKLSSAKSKLNWVKRASALFLVCAATAVALPAQTFHLLHSFDFTDGSNAQAALIQATDGNLYGTTVVGGASYNGTVFKMTPDGTVTTLHDFDFSFYPLAGLVQGSDGNFYGTTRYGGAHGDGTVFKITPSGTFITLHSFDGTDGSYAWGGLVQNTNGAFYGATQEGGANGYGAIYALSVGLAPFVETQPTFDKVGLPVRILGTNLTGATSVTFNGTPATFTVVGQSLITTMVPAGATSGKVQVVTPGGTLTSNVPFRVHQ